MNGRPAANQDEETTSGIGHSLRHAIILMLQRGGHFLGAAAFALLVPRLMGPEVLGQYALLTSVSFWFALLSGMGAVSMITRTVPGLVAVGDHGGVRKLAASLVALRAATGVLTASAYAAVMILAFEFRDVVAVALIAGAIWARTVANVMYALFLGLNNASRWGTGDLVRRWLTLVFILAGFAVGGLRGVCAGFLGANLVVLALGFLLARQHLSLEAVDLSRAHLGAYLRIGTAYAAGNLLLALTQRSGEGLTRLTTGSFTEVGYFGAAFSIYLTIGHALWQLAVSFAPLLIAQAQAGRTAQVAGWLEQLAKGMVIAVVPLAAAASSLGPYLVPWLLGERYAPVAANLVPLTLTLVPLAIGSIGRVGALTIDRPGITASAAGAELAVFWIGGFVAGSRWGSSGVAWAALCGSVVYASWMTIRVRQRLPYSLNGAASALLAGLVFVPLVVVSGRWAATLGFSVATAIYAGLLWRLQIINRAELLSLVRSIRTGSAKLTPPVTSAPGPHALL